MKAELFSAVLGDVLDGLGFRHQFLPAAVRPLRPGMVVAGRAMPVLQADGPPPNARFGKMLEALDSLRQGEVYLADAEGCPYSVWGELMSTRAGKLGAAGAVINGYHRDTAGILALDFPTFSQGSFAQDMSGRGYVADYRVPIRIGHVSISPGDFIFGDEDGVLVIPAGSLDEAVGLALEKARGEGQVGAAFRQGMSAVEAFDRFKVM